MQSCIQASLNELYTLMEKLGEGTFAEVYKAKVISPSEGFDEKVEEFVAIKQITLSPMEHEAAYAEAQKLKTFDNDHIVQYRDAIYDPEEKTLNLIMQLCKSSLRKQLSTSRNYSKNDIVRFLVQIVSAFLELERKHVMHLDLKPENILLTNDYYVKICDFGCSQLAPKSKFSKFSNQMFGTFNYLAPETFVKFEGKKNFSSSDMWSLGIILYEMIYKKLPFPVQKQGLMSRMHLEQYSSKKNIDLIKYDGIPEENKLITDLLKKMLQPQPDERITWKELSQTLIQNFGVEAVQFQNLTKIYHSHLQESKIFLHLYITIEKNIEYNPHRFWKSNVALLTQFKNTLIHLYFIYNLKIFKLFEYKMSDKLNPKYLENLSFLKKHIQYEEFQNCKKENLEISQLKDLVYHEKILVNLTFRVVEQLDKFEAEGLWEAMEHLKYFCEDITAINKRGSSFFCKFDWFEGSKEKLMIY